MPAVLNAAEAFRHLRFQGHDCLYKDHLGRRVVADVEGCGYLAFLTAGCLLSTICDDKNSDRFHPTFTKRLSIVANEPGDIEVGIVCGRHEPPDGNVEIVQDQVEGTGWLVDSAGPVEIDGSKSLSCPVQGVAWPFFRSVVGQGPLNVIRAPSRLVVLQKLSIADEDMLRKVGFRVQNMSRLRMLESAFEDGEIRLGVSGSHLNRSSWQVEVPNGAVGLRIRKIFDRFHGRQRARILVNSCECGWWFEPSQSRSHRWAVSEVGISIPTELQNSVIELSIDPPPGTPLWSFSEIEVAALLHE